MPPCAHRRSDGVAEEPLGLSTKDGAGGSKARRGVAPIGRPSPASAGAEEYVRSLSRRYYDDEDDTAMT